MTKYIILCVLLVTVNAGQLLAQTLMTIPPHSNIYSGMVRGYWFTAPTSFTITGLKVCPEAGTGLQYIHVFKINDPVPVVYATTSTNITTLAYIQGATNNVVQTVSIPVTSGDIIGIIGAVGSGTDNSYSGSVTPYATSINGYSVNLGRIGYQGSIVSASAPNYWTEATGAISRIEMYYVSSCTGTPNAPSITTAAMTTSLCPGGSMSIAASNPLPPVGIQYQWEQSSSSTGPWTNVTGGSGATTLTYTTAALSTSTWFRIKAICGTNTAPSTPYQVVIGGAPAQPGAISGNGSICNGSQTYSVTPVTGATSYTWTLPGGWSGASTTNTITVTPSGSGTISVTANNACGSSTAQSLAVTVGSAPAQPSAITGPPTPCVAAGVAYSVPAISGATTYNWTIPSGWTGSSTTNVINVTVGSGPGTISVTASNGCGTSAATSLSATPVTQPPSPGSITGTASVCAGSTQTYSVPAVSGITYSWVAPAGWVGASTGNSITYTVGSGSGQVSVAAIASCGTSAPSTLSVVSTPPVTPSVSVATTSTTICASTQATFTASAVSTGTAPIYQWKKNGINVGTNSSTYSDAALNSGDVVSVVLTSNAACATVPTATSNSITMSVNPTVVPGININLMPGYTSCTGSSLTFVSNITGGGSNPLYQWYSNGNPITGATSPTYTSSAIINGDSISAVLVSNAPCLVTSSIGSNKMGIVRNPIVTPAVNITSSQTMPIITGSTVTFTANVTGGGSTPFLQWMKNNEIIPYAVNASYTTTTYSNGDIMTVRMISSDPCASLGVVTSAQLAISTQFPASVVTTAGNWIGSLSLYPNPNTGRFSINADWGAGHNGERVYVDLFNNLGQSVYHTEVVPDQAKWSLNVWLPEAVANGMYRLRVQSAGMQAVMPVVIQR